MLESHSMKNPPPPTVPTSYVHIVICFAAKVAPSPLVVSAGKVMLVKGFATAN